MQLAFSSTLSLAACMQNAGPETYDEVYAVTYSIFRPDHWTRQLQRAKQKQSSLCLPLADLLAG